MKKNKLALLGFSFEEIWIDILRKRDLCRATNNNGNLESWDSKNL